MSPRAKVEVKPGQRWAYKVAGKRPDIKIEWACNPVQGRRPSDLVPVWMVTECATDGMGSSFTLRETTLRKEWRLVAEVTTSTEANAEPAPLDLVRWTIVVPISGEATLEVMLPKGSTKYDAVRVYEYGKCRVVDHEWHYDDNPSRGEGPCVTGPGCDGEEVCLDDEADEENEE